MERITATEARLGLARVLDRVDAERIPITRDGADVAVLVAPWEAELLAGLVETRRERQPPYTDDESPAAQHGSTRTNRPVRSDRYARRGGGLMIARILLGPPPRSATGY